MCNNKFKIFLKENKYSILIILSAILGLIFGFILKSIWTISPIVLTYIGLPGTLIMRASAALIVPMIVTSLSTSIASTKRGENKKLVAMTFTLAVAFSTFTTIFGIFLMSVMKPGVGRVHNPSDEYLDSKLISSQRTSSEDETIYDTFMNLIPDNIVSAMFMSHYTALVPIKANNISIGYKKVSEKSFKTNMLGLCVFSFVLGFVLNNLDEKANYIKVVLLEINAIIMKILLTIIKFMWIGMFFWMCVEAIKMKSPEKILTQFTWFIATALLAFTLVLLVLYPSLYFLIIRKNPYKFYYNIIPALIVAFGSSSSLVTLPMNMKCMEEKNKLPKAISNLVLPLCININMNGTALYYPMVTVFVAQMHGIDLAFQQLITLGLFAIIISLVMPAAPSGGSSAVAFITFCAIVGIDNPLNILAYTVAMDWIMDRMRTIVNVSGDCFVAAFVGKLCEIY